MLKFAANDFWKASQTLAEWSANSSAALSPGRNEEIIDSFGKFIRQVRSLSLPVTLRELEKFHKWVNAEYAPAAEALKKLKSATTGSYKNLNVEFSHRLARLSSVLHSEIESRTFFYVPPDRALYYDDQELLGKGVIEKFPVIQFDVVEAGNCYAVGRGTACVFHLMRIMEVGVQRLGTKLGVCLVDQKNWQNILDEINKAIKTLPKASTTVEMCQASANLYSVKLAWRNEVMHPNDTYTLEEAENLLRQVKLFMSHLATIV